MLILLETQVTYSKGALRQSSYSNEKKRKLEQVLELEYMSPEESAWEEASDEEGAPRLEKLIIRKFECRSEELERELRSLDRKANRARSERGKRMMMKRGIGGSLPGSLRTFPKGAPSWTLAEELQ